MMNQLTDSVHIPSTPPRNKQTTVVGRTGRGSEVTQQPSTPSQMTLPIFKQWFKEQHFSKENQLERDKVHWNVFDSLINDSRHDPSQ